MADLDAFPCVRNAPYRLTFPLTNTADALVTGETPTVNLSINSAAFATSTNAAVEIGASGIYYVDFTEAEMGSDSNAIAYITSANATDQVEPIPFLPHIESGVLQAATATSATLRLSAINTDDFFNGMILEIVRGTGFGQTRTITDYAGQTVACTLDRAWAVTPDSSSVYAIHGVGVNQTTDIFARANATQIQANTTAATILAGFSEGMAVLSSVSDATPTNTSWNTAAGLNADDDHYNAAICLFTSGTNTGLARQIIDWDGGGLLMTTNAFPDAPANGDSFAIFGKVF